MVRRVRAALGLLVALPFLLLFNLLPRPWSHFLGRRFGVLAYRLSRRSRLTALENLQQRLGVGRREAGRIAKASLMQAGAAVMDLLRAPRVTAAVVDRDLAIPEATRRTIDRIRTSGKGGVIACCHLGNWEFLSLCWPLLDTPETLLVVRPPRDPLARKLFHRLRAWTGQTVIHRTGAVRRCVRHVARGGVAAIPFDLPVPPQAGARPSPFFGLDTFTTMAPGYVAAKTGAPLYLTYTVPLGMQRYRFFLEEVAASAERDPRAAAADLMARLNVLLERAIREYPAGWAWWLKRWSIRPDAQPPDAWPSYSHVAALHVSASGPRRD